MAQIHRRRWRTWCRLKEMASPMPERRNQHYVNAEEVCCHVKGVLITEYLVCSRIFSVYRPLHILVLECSLHSRGDSSRSKTSFYVSSLMMQYFAFPFLYDTACRVTNRKKAMCSGLGRGGFWDFVFQLLRQLHNASLFLLFFVTE